VKPMLYPLSYSPALCWQSWIVITTDSDELIVYYGPQTRKHAAKTHLSGMHRLLYTTGRVRLDVRLIPDLAYQLSGQSWMAPGRELGVRAAIAMHAQIASSLSSLNRHGVAHAFCLTRFFLRG
jgi:hypothetical protein